MPAKRTPPPSKPKSTSPSQPRPKRPAPSATSPAPLPKRPTARAPAPEASTAVESGAPIGGAPAELETPGPSTGVTAPPSDWPAFKRPTIDEQRAATLASFVTGLCSNREQTIARIQAAMPPGVEVTEKQISDAWRLLFGIADILKPDPPYAGLQRDWLRVSKCLSIFANTETKGARVDTCIEDIERALSPTDPWSVEMLEFLLRQLDPAFEAADEHALSKAIEAELDHVRRTPGKRDPKRAAGIAASLAVQFGAFGVERVPKNVAVRFKAAVAQAKNALKSHKSHTRRQRASMG